MQDTSDSMIKEIEKEFNINDQEYVNIFTEATYYPSLIIPFLGGILADKYGQKKIYLINSLLLLLGNFFVWFGVYKTNWYIILVGKIIVGFNLELFTIG